MDKHIDFDEGFDKWMFFVIEYERLARQGKPISRELRKCIDESRDWLHNLSDEEYSRLIHRGIIEQGDSHGKDNKTEFHRRNRSHWCIAIDRQIG